MCKKTVFIQKVFDVNDSFLILNWIVFRNIKKTCTVIKHGYKAHDLKCVVKQKKKNS